ncbi:MAG: hypothetical protein LAO78_10910 [Acidobacteriia bacterium]|nr:hypothetical protein [Terriglobia bacterium]
MILSLTEPFGTSISLDFRKQLGEPVELQAFHFVTPPIEFRLLRGDLPLQEWQTIQICMTCNTALAWRSGPLVVTGSSTI